MKKKETTQIPSHIALGAIGILASIAIIAILAGNYQLNQVSQSSQPNPADTKNVIDSAPTSVKLADNCSVKAFTGEAQIRVWPAKGEAADTVQVNDEDVRLLPSYASTSPEATPKNVKVKIIDPTPALESSLTSASSEKPANVKIQGYLSRCNDKIALASLEYKDKIFHDFIND